MELVGMHVAVQLAAAPPDVIDFLHCYLPLLVLIKELRYFICSFFCIGRQEVISRSAVMEMRLLAIGAVWESQIKIWLRLSSWCRGTGYL